MAKPGYPEEQQLYLAKLVKRHAAKPDGWTRIARAFHRKFKSPKRSADALRQQHRRQENRGDTQPRKSGRNYQWLRSAVDLLIARATASDASTPELRNERKELKRLRRENGALRRERDAAYRQLGRLEQFVSGMKRRVQTRAKGALVEHSRD